VTGEESSEASTMAETRKNSVVKNWFEELMDWVPVE
jgi:hypothetical protein